MSLGCLDSMSLCAECADDELCLSNNVDPDRMLVREFSLMLATGEYVVRV